jgi:hypothetical protein
MKNLVLLLIVSMLFSCGNSTITENTPGANTDWNKFNLNGEVKSFREIKILAVDNFSIIAEGKKVRHIYNKEVLFNLDGNKIEKNDYIPDGTLEKRTMFLYRGDQLVEYNNYDSQGMLFGTGKYESNDDDLVSSLHYKTTDGRYNWNETYKYDSDGKLIEMQRFKTKEVIDDKEKYSFNENGSIKESEFYKKNKILSKNRYKYTESKDNYSELVFGDTTIFKYKYIYDVEGNWIKKIIFENDNPSGILLREIEYFN